MWCYIYYITFEIGKIIKNDNFVVSSDDDVLKLISERFIRIALGDINKITVRIFANVSDLNICYYLKTSLASSLERLFFKKISNNEEYINTYWFGKHTKFGNDCIPWFTYNISKVVGECIIVCYEYETYVES